MLLKNSLWHRIQVSKMVKLSLGSLQFLSSALIVFGHVIGESAEGERKGSAIETDIFLYRKTTNSRTSWTSRTCGTKWTPWASRTAWYSRTTRNSRTSRPTWSQWAKWTHRTSWFCWSSWFIWRKRIER